MITANELAAFPSRRNRRTGLPAHMVLPSCGKHLHASPLLVLPACCTDLRLLHTIETLSNPNGLLTLSPSADAAVLACPGLHPGQVCRRGLGSATVL